MDFRQVLVTDNLAWELFASAAREGSLFYRQATAEDVASLMRPTRRLARQRALALLVLFDRLVIHDINEDFRIPDLEKEGIVEVVQTSGGDLSVAPLPILWGRGNRPKGLRPPKSLMRSLALVQRFKPFVVNRMLEIIREVEFFPAVAHHLKISLRRCVDEFFDYAIGFAQGNREAIKANIFARALPNELLVDITKGLYQFKDPLHAGDTALICAILAADQILKIQALSSKLGIGVATEHYGQVFRSEPALNSKQLDAVSSANTFLVLRAAFAEEGGLIPRVNSIKDAVLLRKDPRLKNLRTQLSLLHKGLSVGDRNAVAEARREIRIARRRLHLRAGWERALRWVAYLSVPVGIAEVLSSSPPVIGTSIAVVGAAGVAGSRKVERDNEWVLFGS